MLHLSFRRFSLRRPLEAPALQREPFTPPGAWQVWAKILFGSPPTSGFGGLPCPACKVPEDGGAPMRPASTQAHYLQCEHLVSPPLDTRTAPLARCSELGVGGAGRAMRVKPLREVALHECSGRPGRPGRGSPRPAVPLLPDVGQSCGELCGEWRGRPHARGGGGRSNGPAFVRDLSDLGAKGGWAENSTVLPGSLLFCSKTLPLKPQFP